MAVDTYGMLNTLKELEMKLAEHHRQDVLLGSVLPRLDMLEKEREFNKATFLTATSPTLPSKEHLLDHSTEERVLQKIQRSIDSVSDKYSMQLESKLSSVSMELDRVHKLLAARPTTSDLSKIMYTVQEMSINLSKSVNENRSYVESAIRDQVANEMSSLIDNIKSSGDLSLRGVDGILKQIENISTEVNQVRAASVKADSALSACESRLSEVTQAMAALKTDLRDTSNSEHEFLQMQAKFTLLEAHIEEAFKRTQEVKTNLVERIAPLEMRVVEVSSSMIVSEFNTNNSIEEVQKGAEETAEKLAALDQLVNGRVDGLHQSVLEVSGSLDKYEGLLMHLKAANVIKTLNGHSTHLVSADAQIKELNDYNRDLLIQIHSLQHRLQAAEEACVALKGAQLSAQMDTQVGIEAAFKKAEDQTAHRIDGVVADFQRQVEDVADSMQQVSNLGEGLAALDERIRGVIRDVAHNTSALEDFHNSASASLRTGETAHKKLVSEVSEFPPQLEMLSGKLRLLVAQMEQIDEQRKAAKRTEESTPRRGNKLFGGISFKHNPSSVGRGTSERKDSPNRGKKFSLGRKTLEEIKSERTKDPTQRVSRENKRVNSITEESFVKPNSPESRFMDFSGVPDDDIFFDVLPDFDSEMEEIKEEILSQAQYTAELCIAYEESSLKQTRVLEMPRAMCEHLTQTAQALTAFASNLADTEIVTRILKASPNEISYDDSSVNTVREEKMEQFVKDVIASIRGTSVRNPGVIRLEAREKFLGKLRTALVICMSKHDQVFVKNVILWSVCNGFVLGVDCGSFACGGNQDS